MKKLLIFSLLFLTSCDFHLFKYQIKGQIVKNQNGKTKTYNSVWYTDTFDFDEDTIYYFNSDGSETRIYPPYTVIQKYK
jgi:hypothetical protein